MSQMGRGGYLQEPAGVTHHGTPQTREVFALLLAKGVILSPELRDPTVDVSGGVLGVEVVEIVLCDGFLGAFPHQTGNPGDEDVADGVGIDGVNLRSVLDLIDLLGESGFEIDVIKALVSGLESRFGVRRADRVCSGSGGRRGACPSS